MDAKTPQGDKFAQAARELECDESEERFDEAMRKIAKQKPPEDDGKDEKEEPAE